MRYVELGDGVAVTGQKGERGEILDSGHRSDSAAQQLVQLVHIDFRYPLGLFQREDAVVVGVEITYFLAIIQESGVGDLIEDVQLAFYEFRPDGDVFRRHGERRQAGRFIRKLHAAALDDPAAEGIAVVGDGREGDRCAFLRFGYGPAVAPRFAVAADRRLRHAYSTGSSVLSFSQEVIAAANSVSADNRKGTCFFIGQIFVRGLTGAITCKIRGAGEKRLVDSGKTFVDSGKPARIALVKGICPVRRFLPSRVSDTPRGSCRIFSRRL